MCPTQNPPSRVSRATEVASEASAEPARVTEYTLAIEGIIELPDTVEPRAFFAGLLEHILAYVEAFDGLAGLTMHHRPYTSDETEESDEEGKTPSQNG